MTPVFDLINFLLDVSTFLPLYSITPLVGVYKVAINLNSVDFPLPLPPMMQMCSPLLMLRLMGPNVNVLFCSKST